MLICYYLVVVLSPVGSVPEVGLGRPAPDGQRAVLMEHEHGFEAAKRSIGDYSVT